MTQDFFISRFKSRLVGHGNREGNTGSNLVSKNIGHVAFSLYVL